MEKWVKKWIVGVDIGGTTIKVAFISMNGGYTR